MSAIASYAKSVCVHDTLKRVLRADFRAPIGLFPAERAPRHRCCFDSAQPSLTILASGMSYKYIQTRWNFSPPMRDCRKNQFSRLTPACGEVLLSKFLVPAGAAGGVWDGRDLDGCSVK